MSWLRIALLFTVIASLISTMVMEATGTKAFLGCLSGAVIGLLWALLLRYSPQHEAAKWKQMAENITEAQNLIDQIRGHRRELYGLSPRTINSPFEFLEILAALPVIALFFAIGYMLTLDLSLNGYVLDLRRPHPPEPKTLLLYLGFLLSFSAAFLGLFSKLLSRLFQHKHNATTDSAP
jgi:ABC-type transport system involved in multi-copper enzyme maturation permease subunit